MQNLFKRLKHIQSCIELNDLDIIELQVAKLQQYQLDKEADSILISLQNDDFGTAVLKIENYLEKYTKVEAYQYQELRGLKLKVKALEQQIQKNRIIRDSYLHYIQEFETRYQIQLGQIILNILDLEKQKLIQDNNRQANQKAKEDAEQFRENHEAVQKIAKGQLNITIDEKDESKQLLKEIVKLRYSKAKQIPLFSNLEIQGSLKSVNEAVDDKDSLQDEIWLLRTEIDELLAEIREIEEDETFQMIQGIDDLDVFFAEKKKALQERHVNMKYGPDEADETVKTSPRDGETQKHKQWEKFDSESPGQEDIAQEEGDSENFSSAEEVIEVKIDKYWETAF